ncbi:MAG: hypothetical protein ACREMW_00625 [Gemmatimonadales bacterium]
MVLRDTVRIVDADRATAEALLTPELLFRSKSRGEVQYVNLMWLLDLTYTDSRQETIVRRIALWWPMCM